MSRELKRVPLNFKWPLQKIWEGYVRPDSKARSCPDPRCLRGETADSNWLYGICTLLHLMGENGAMTPAEAKARGFAHPHPYLSEGVPHVRDRRLPPGPDSAKLIEALAGEYPGPGAASPLTIYRRLLELTGMPSDWGVCKICKGTGKHPEDTAIVEAESKWERTHPPIGDGYQVWETVSEGSPISPVFETEDQTIQWLVNQGYTEKASREFVRETLWAPSLTLKNEEFYEDIEASGI